MENDPCPPECQCSTYAVKCIGMGLKTIPKGIPLAARQIDLSNNPSIQIPHDYFLRFKHLFILSLHNCRQKGPIYLPKTVRDVRLGLNAFNVNALQEMLSGEVKLLRRIDLTNNSLRSFEVQRLLRFLPTKLEDIKLDYNNITKLRRNDIRSLTNIMILSMLKCSLSSIEPNSFDNMKRLHQLFLGENELVDLPDNLFHFNAEITHLYLERNSLTKFNTSKLGLKSVQHLFLPQNKLKEVVITVPTLFGLRLEDNKIEQLTRNTFNNVKQIYVLALFGNRIRFISKDAFNHTNTISQLLLHNNTLTSLPSGLFNTMEITQLFLQNNHLSQLNGIFDGMTQVPTTLDLSGNKELTSLNGTDLHRLSHTSTVYLTCGNLRRITDLSKLPTSIQCSPKANLRIDTITEEGLVCNGYQCQYIPSKLQYNCFACRRGYYSDCKDSHSIEGQCVSCPPGSYYQDQSASKNCKECRPGQFVPPEKSPGTSPLDCQTCPQGTNTTVLAGTRACKCLHGYSRSYRFGPCHKCNHNGFDCTSHDYQILQNGFWMTWKGVKPDNTRRKTTSYNRNRKKTICQDMYYAFIKNLHIQDDTYDRSTMRFSCQMPLPIKCPMSASCNGGMMPACSHGYNGVLCAVCDRGYSLQFNKCIQCPQPLWASLQFIGYIALFVIFCFIISLADQIIIDESRNCLQRKEQYDSRTFADIILSSLKILIGFYQIFISIMHAFSNIHWPHSLKAATNILQYVQFQIIKLPSLRCIKPQWNINAVDEFWIMFIIIITIPFLSLLYYFIKSIYIHFQYLAPSVAKHIRYICARNCIKYVALFLFVTYPLISTKTIQILPISCHSFCTAYQNHNCVHSMSFLRSDYSIPCPTMADHKATLITGYICLLIPFGLPIILFMLLRSYAPTQRRSTGQPITDMIDHTYDDSDADNLLDYPIVTTNDNDNENLSGDSTVPVITSALKFSYENYHVRYWYWEVIEMIRKLLMTIGIVLFLRHTKIGLTCTLIVAMIFTVLHAIIKPLKNNFESTTQFVSLVLVPLNLAYGAVLQSQDTQNTSSISKEKDSYYEGMFLVIMNSTLIIIVIVRIIVVCIKKVRLKMK